MLTQKKYNMFGIRWVTSDAFILPFYTIYIVKVILMFSKGNICIKVHFCFCSRQLVIETSLSLQLNLSFPCFKWCKHKGEMTEISVKSESLWLARFPLVSSDSVYKRISIISAIAASGKISVCLFLSVIHPEISLDRTNVS